MATKRLSKSKWLSHMQAWESSDISQRDYCEREGISFSRFKNQRYRLLRQKALVSQSSPSNETFKPMMLPASPPKSDYQTELVLELPGAIRLTIRSGQ